MPFRSTYFLLTLLWFSFQNLQAQPLRYNPVLDAGFLESQSKIAGRYFSPYDSKKVPMDITSMHLKFNIEPDTKFLEAQVDIYFDLPEPVQAAIFYLSDSLNIQALVLNEKDTLSIHRPAKDEVWLYPSKGLDSGTHHIQFIYSGRPPTTGFGSFVFSEHRNTPVIWTLSQPYGASDWFPTHQRPNDKIDVVSMEVEVPKPLKVVSNGLLVRTKDLGTRQSYWWVHSYPIAPYLISLAIADYDEISFVHVNESGDSLRINNYVWKGQDLREIEKQARQTLPLMDLFSELYGPYPFARESYGHAQVGFMGGMEHQTMSSMNNFGYFLVAHELAHQWFGNQVTNRNWNDLWIQEGFATFSEALSLERFIGKADYQHWFDVRRTFITARSDGSVYLSNELIEERKLSRMFDYRLTYVKAAWVIHMLRQKMGDEAFFTGVRAHLDQYAYKAASTEDFKNVMELQYGASLDRFFADWVYGQGYPQLNLKYQRSTESNGAVWLDVEQIGSHESVPIFDFDLDVRLIGKKDTLITIQVDSQKQRFLLQPTMEWETIEIDPQVRLLYASMVLTSNADNSKPEIPSAFILEQGYPNPFNPNAVIPVTVNETGELIVDVLDVQGKLIQRLHRAQVQPGRRDILWEAGSLSSGVYLIRARLGMQTQTIKMTLLR